MTGQTMVKYINTNVPNLKMIINFLLNSAVSLDKVPKPWLASVALAGTPGQTS